VEDSLEGLTQTKKKKRMPAGEVESGRLHLSLSEASFADFERAFLAHQRQWLREARSPQEKTSIKRRTAEDILLGAYGRKCTWEEFNRALRRSERLGHTNPGRRAHVACLFALSIKQFPAQSTRARRMLDAAERRLLFLPKKHHIRREFIREIQRIRRMAGWSSSTPGAR
jgi:hypothetical protein